MLRKGSYAECVGAGVPVYLAAEVLELTGNASRDYKKTRFIPRHLQWASICIDEELHKLLSGVTIAQGGVLLFFSKDMQYDALSLNMANELTTNSRRTGPTLLIKRTEDRQF